MSEESRSSSQTKSKQERIRDNQRRSRARRQEYLADLERRLADCQVTCREADIQRAAYLELQIENTRLKELLALAGVNDEFIENYISQAAQQTSGVSQDSQSALRHIKPKLSSITTKRSPIPVDSASWATKSSGQGTPTSATPVSAVATEPTRPQILSSTVYSPPSIYNQNQEIPPTLSTHSSSEWAYDPSSDFHAQGPFSGFYCNIFDIAAAGPARIADENSVLCSVAKQMIEQFNLTPQEMEVVKVKLSTGQCRPAYVGAGCAVDNSTLFQILSDLNTRYG